MPGLEEIIKSPVWQLIVSGGVVILQLYIVNKLTPVKKDVESLRRDFERLDRDIEEIGRRCYENHKKH